MVIITLSKNRTFYSYKRKSSNSASSDCTNEIINFYLDGDEPSYVDMPIWYTHNITNIGEEELYTQFWINEWYDPKDGDTYFEHCEK